MGIRSYQDEDFPELENILKKTDLFNEEFDDRGNYKRQIEHDPTSILVATDGDRVVGGVISFYNPCASFIFHLCVDPEYQRRSIGTNLMNEAEKNLKDRGAEVVVLYVDGDNERVASFYERLGWGSYPGATPMVKRLE